jgi:hypothetical protein
MNVGKVNPLCGYKTCASCGSPYMIICLTHNSFQFSFRFPVFLDLFNLTCGLQMAKKWPFCIIIYIVTVVCYHVYFLHVPLWFSIARCSRIWKQQVLQAVQISKATSHAVVGQVLSQSQPSWEYVCQLYALLFCIVASCGSKNTTFFFF